MTVSLLYQRSTAAAAMPAITAAAPNLRFSAPRRITTTAVIPYSHTVSNGSRNTDRNAFHHRASRILRTTDCRTKRDRLPLSLFRASDPVYTFIPDRLLPIIISPRNSLFLTVSGNQTSPRPFSSCRFRQWSQQMQIPGRGMYRHNTPAFSEHPDTAVFP